MIPFDEFLDQAVPPETSGELLRRRSLLDEVSIAEHEPDDRLLDQLLGRQVSLEDDEHELLQSD